VKSTEQIIARATAETDAGRMWRAKEILRGAIGGGRAEPSILEAYGRLLDALGDRVEAGKYLFLCGVRTPAYTEPILLFTRRNRKRHGAAFAAELPAALRRHPFASLPDNVQEDLRAFGVGSEMFDRRTAARATPWPDRMATVGMVIVLLLLGFTFAVGVIVVTSWLWNAVVG